MRAVNIQVIGRVQGVSFRFSTMNKGKSLKLAGWVKNQIDGSVKIYAQGTESHIASLIEWCYIGPPAAKVDKVIIVDLKQKDTIQLESFEIIR